MFLSTVGVENSMWRLGFDPLINAFLSVLNLEEVFFFFFSISMFLYSFDYFDRVVVLDTIGIEKSMMDKISD